MSERGVLAGLERERQPLVNGTEFRSKLRARFGVPVVGQATVASPSSGDLSVQMHAGCAQSARAHPLIVPRC
jgi:hypothetical protein